MTAAYITARAGDASPAGNGADDRRDRERRIEIVRSIWAEARNAHGSPVVRYLADLLPVPTPRFVSGNAP